MRLGLSCLPVIWREMMKIEFHSEKGKYLISINFLNTNVTFCILRGLEVDGNKRKQI
jgi:hypothetical protein